MRNAFVETSNVKRFLSALAALSQRGAEEACLLVVDGPPGLGKTTTLQKWVSKTGSVYLRAKKEWTPTWFMNNLLEALKVPPPHSFQKRYARALEELGERQRQAQFKGRVFGLVVDEADHVSSKSAILETIRDISDMIELPTILVGMGKINDNLQRFPQVASRVSQRVRFEKASREDVRALVDVRCEVKVADDLLDFTLKAADGFNREILEAIANIERFGLRNEPDDGGLTMADMSGQLLLNDRKSSNSIIVPEVF